MAIKEIACFISPHGFGHATRTVAVLEALQHLEPDLHPHIFTTVPQTLLAETLTNFTYHPVQVDIGLVQTSALDLDIEATIANLDSFLPYSQKTLDKLAVLCRNCSFALCDIAPIGITVARRAGIPSVLVENFTWDWIYAPYLKSHPKIAPHTEFLLNEFTHADYHIQTEPLCKSSTRDLVCGPIFRQARRRSTDIIKQLNCSGKKIILITLGGIPHDLPIWEQMEKHSDFFFIFSGQQKTENTGKNVLHLSRDCDLYHPDLICAADLVAIKTGYSTVAECCQAGSRVISVGRSNFAESEVLQTYIGKVLGGVSIDPDTFLSGKWFSLIPKLLASPAPPPAKENGADVVARFLQPLL